MGKFPAKEFTKALIRSMFAPGDAGHVCILPSSLYPASHYRAVLESRGVRVYGENTIQGITGFLIRENNIQEVRRILRDHGAAYTFYDSRTGTYATSPAVELVPELMRDPGVTAYRLL